MTRPSTISNNGGKTKPLTEHSRDVLIRLALAGTLPVSPVKEEMAAGCIPINPGVVGRLTRAPRPLATLSYPERRKWLTITADGQELATHGHFHRWLPLHYNKAGALVREICDECQLARSSAPVGVEYRIDLATLSIYANERLHYTEPAGGFDREGLRMAVEALGLERAAEKALLKQIPPSEYEIRFHAQKR